MPSERAPELAEVIRRAIEARLLDVHVSLPVKVVKYDAAKQRVDVKPLVRRAAFGEDGARTAESMPVIPGVPVLFPGAGGFQLTFPICDGSTKVDGTPDTPEATTGLVIFAEASLDKWLSGKGEEVDPEIDHTHALPDAVFLPELRTFINPRPNVPTDHAALGSAAGVQLHFRGTLIAAGEEAGNDFVALAKKVGDTLKRLQVVLNALFSATAAPINEPGNGAPSALQIALKSALSAAHITDVVALDHTWPDDVAAGSLKAK